MLEIKSPPTITESREQALARVVRDNILREIVAERAYQDAKWGGAKHDDQEETTASFVGYVVEYATGSTDRSARHDIRTRLIKAAALAVAAVESIDRKAAADQEERVSSWKTSS